MLNLGIVLNSYVIKIIAIRHLLSFLAHEEELEDNGLALPSALALPPAVQGTLLSPLCDAGDVVIRFQKDLDLDQTSLESPNDETKIMIRRLAKGAKILNRLDVVKHLREVSPAGITGRILTA